MMYRCLPTILASFGFFVDGRLNDISHGENAIAKSRLLSTCENPDGNAGFLKVTIKTEETTESDEISFEVVNGDGTSFLSATDGFQPSTEYDFCTILPEDCYTFTITDAFGNGLCCLDGQGFYRIQLNDVALTFGGEFGRKEEYEFCVGAPSLSPSVSAAPSLSVSLSVVPSLSSAPSNSSVPSLSLVPSVSLAPSNSSAPSGTQAPSNSSAPSVSDAPSVSSVPSLSLMPSLAPSLCSEGLVTIKITALGNVADETKFTLTRNSPPAETIFNETLGINEELDVLKCLDPGFHTFNITDENGLCCDGDQYGLFEVFLDGVLLTSGSTFDDSVEVEFEYAGPSLAPSISDAPSTSEPTVSSAPSVSDSPTVDLPKSNWTASLSEEYPFFRFTEWDNLSNETQETAARLGYTNITWNEPGANDIEALSFAYLSPSQEADAKALGFETEVFNGTEISPVWDCYVNHYLGYSWEELATAGVQTFWINLGATSGTWPTKPSPSSVWAGLTGGEQEAATNLCYNEYSWAMASLENWDASLKGPLTDAPTIAPTDAPTVAPVTPTISPTMSPTASPTMSPTASPTMSPTIYTCKDSTAKYETINDDGKEIKTYCNKTDIDDCSMYGVSEHCPLTCNNCGCHDTPLKFKINFSDDDSQWKSCNWVKKYPGTRCGYDGVFSACLKSCQMCTPEPTMEPTMSPTMAPTVSPTTSPTMSPTVSPTMAPTVSLSVSPTMTPTMSASPTMYPTLSPTASPTVSPTMSPTPCGATDWSFRVGGQGTGCGWVGHKPYLRCLVSTGAKEACGQQCCGITAPEPEGPCPAATDWGYRYDGQKGRGCGWIEDEPETRCPLEGAREACVVCCGV